MLIPSMQQSRAHALPIFDWVTVPAGACPIGEDAIVAPAGRQDDMPAGNIELPTYWIARTPITNTQYAAFVAATGHRAPAHWEAAAPPAMLGQHPVTYVDWHDAGAFCAWARVRLPTEAEWEKAARGDDGRPFPWGADAPGSLFANSGGRFGTTTPVGSFPAGASPYGALDMAGNVWEWTASAFLDSHSDGRAERAAASPRVLRGGSFNHGAADLRCAARDRLYADACDEYIGFRVVSDDARIATPLNLDWVHVPAGAFLIGAVPQDYYQEAQNAPSQPGLGMPRHTVELPAFAIARTPITNAQYAAFVAATGYRAPAHWEGSAPPAELAQHPIVYVDWHDARAFCAWARVRLPTEAEWEKAARGADVRPFPWGADAPDPTRAWFDQHTDAIGTRPVGERPAGASPYGALDMAGNVWEWTASLHWPYPYRSDDGRESQAAPGQRVLRGGSFRSAHERYLRCAFRSRSYPARRRDHIGFRVARSIDRHRNE
jgi:formylglycine-generating enzyme required for sulfatase activity